MTAAEILPWVAAMTPVLVIAVGYLVNRRLQRANASRADAETRLADSHAEKVAHDVQATIIANTKALLAEARTVQAEKDAIKEERIATLGKRINRVETRFEAMRASLAAHGVWDAAALIDLRDVKPEYPPPPPFPNVNLHVDVEDDDDDDYHEP